MSILEFMSHNAVTLVIAAVVLFVLVRSLRIANQYERGVVFRLGKYSRTAGPGLYIVWFLIEWQNRIDLRTVTTAVEQQEAITRDNVPIKVDTVVWYRIVDPEHAVMEVRGVANAVEQVSLTTLRALLGEHSLDEILKSQDEISGLMQRAIDRATEPWGVKVERVQMKTSRSRRRCSVPWRRRPRRCVRSGRA